MKTEPIPQRKQPFGWLFWTVIVVIVFAFSGLTCPKVIRSERNVPLTNALHNLRQVGLALYEFESEYGSYPNEATVALVTEKNPDHGYDLSGTSSNALFRQLVAAKMLQSEGMFYAKVPGINKPDDNFTPSNALAPGEVAFGYIAGLSTQENPARPLAFCPIIPGTDRFDPKPFDGRTAILRIDNSVVSLKINEDGQAITASGQPLLSPDNPIWNGHVPDIRYPDLPPPEKPNFFQKLFTD